MNDDAILDFIDMNNDDYGDCLLKCKACGREKDSVERREEECANLCKSCNDVA